MEDKDFFNSWMNVSLGGYENISIEEIKQLVETTPNDQELGAKIRKLIKNNENII